VHGLLIIDKPGGVTSHDVVARMRRVLGERRIGHTGTLDPAATGVLPLVVGRATRLAQFLSSADKSYDATIRLGMATETYDSGGRPTGSPYSGPFPSPAEVEAALMEFHGTFVQQPPAFSAKKIDGRRSYTTAREAARGGERAAVLPAPVSVTVHALDLVSVEHDRVQLRVECSAGFYVRSLAHDLGVRLGTGAHLEALRRLKSGDAAIADALALVAAERDPAAAAMALVPMGRMLPHFDALVLTADGVRHAAQGRELGPSDVVHARCPVTPFCRLIDERGDLVGIAQPGKAPGVLHPCIVLV
jgi:tRNA pseudouridine55 synthase